jgi:hypothetical protein
MSRPLIIVTRGSPLALQQAKDAAQHLEKSLQVKTEIKILTTTGDRQAAWSLEKQGGKGLFTAELEQALQKGEADVAIHSAKDLPTEMPAGLTIASCLPRRDPRDVLHLLLLELGVGVEARIVELALEGELERAHARGAPPGVRRSAAEGGLMPPPHCVFAAYTPHSGVAAKGAAAPVVVAAFLLCPL